MLRPYLKIWEWEGIFGRAVKAISSLGVRSPCLLLLLGHQIGSTSNIVLGEEGVRNSEKLYHLWTPSRHGLATLFCCHYFIVDVTIKGNNVMILSSSNMLYNFELDIVLPGRLRVLTLT